MKPTPVILPSLLDNDLYKFTMQQGALELFDTRRARYRFINRGQDRFTPAMLERLRASIDAMVQLRLTPAERTYLEGKGLFKKPYLDYLEAYRYNPRQVQLGLTADGQLAMTIDGPWVETILWEVPLMALVSQVALDEKAPLADTDRTAFATRTLEKARLVRTEGLALSEFGTRRRRDFQTQETVVRLLKENAGPTFAGTSNVHFAMKFNLPAIGTMAHEWVMAHAALFGVEKANPKALDSWRKIYPNKLKVFLPDTYTSDLAFATLTDEQIKYLDGFRWDSGDAREFTQKYLARLWEAEVDPLTKKVVYSDSLTLREAAALGRDARGKINAAYGIGTHLTNDFPTPALKIVIKLDALDGIAVAKISDTPAKASGDPKAVANALRVIHDFKLKQETSYEVA